jgi:hypothetical protein
MAMQRVAAERSEVEREGQGRGMTFEQRRCAMCDVRCAMCDV